MDQSYSFLERMNVHPKHQDRAYRDQFLDFVLMWGALKGFTSVAGVTRSKDFRHTEHQTMQENMNKRGKHGNHIDPNLCFHEYHGANIRCVVENYRQDTEHAGNGILIKYQLHNTKNQVLKSTISPKSN
mmetsp:Transcript_20702/g.31611  ORF Transcript_20702/g.31611 Transcript_20702/m.31611 type:complete len:129 (+) Transcript_20702:303-689(+)